MERMLRLGWILFLLLNASLAGAETASPKGPAELDIGWIESRLDGAGSFENFSWLSPAESAANLAPAEKNNPLLSGLLSALNRVQFSIEGDSWRNPVYCLRLCMGW